MSDATSFKPMVLTLAGGLALMGRLKRHCSLVMGSATIGAVGLVAIILPFFVSLDPNLQDLKDTLQSPSLAHIFGTDGLGRDLFARVIFGARISLLEVLVGVGLATITGVPLGLLAGIRGGILDRIVTWLADIIFAFPAVILAILIVSILGGGLLDMLLAIAFFSIPIYVRLSRNLAISIKQREYVHAAVALGAGLWRIMFDHVLRNALGPLAVQASLSAGTVILTAASLSFLGLGAPPPLPEWGAMISDGRIYVGICPWVSFFPGVAVMIMVLGFNMLGDGLRDLVDPRGG